mgnify:CR=1 FL=1
MRCWESRQKTRADDRVIQVENVIKRFPGGQEALKGLSLSVETGEMVFVTGASGAGKSTLIRCINRLVEPTSGNVLLNGENVTKLGSSALRRARRTMGMIFQEYALVERLTVMENVLSGRLGNVGFAAWVWPDPKCAYPQAEVI